jgi:hypothetical protein
MYLYAQLQGVAVNDLFIYGSGSSSVIEQGKSSPFSSVTAPWNLALAMCVAVGLAHFLVIIISTSPGFIVLSP